MFNTKNRVLKLTKSDQGYCYWDSYCYLRICFGSESKFTPGMKIKFNPVIKDYSGSSNSFQGILTISDLPKIPAAVSIIQGPDLVSSCDTLVLDATSSKSVVGRSLTFYWEIFFNSDSEHFLTSSEPVLSMTGLDPGDYTAKLSVRNYLGGIGVSYKQVNNFLIFKKNILY